jgi:hypothetical protein
MILKKGREENHSFIFLPLIPKPKEEQNKDNSKGEIA